MNNLKKVALTALGASLAATSANAVDVSVSGGSEIGYGTGSTNNASNKASSFGVGTGVSFSASGELDNGWTVSTTHATSGAFALTSSNISVDTGSMGKVRFNRIAAASVNANDDILPTAWEEANDNADHSVRGTRLADGLTSGSISLILPTFEFGGGTIDVSLDYDPAVNAAGGGNPGVTASRASGMGSGMAVGAKLGFGPVTLYGGYAEEESTVGTDGNDGKNVMVQAVASFGQVSIGAGEWYANEENGGIDYSTTGMSVAFNVNDDLSMSYGELEDTQENIGATSGVTTDIKSIQVAYSMGSMAVKAKRVETDNPYNQTVANSTEHTEVSVSFSF